MATAPASLPQESVSQFDLQREINNAEVRRPWPSGIYSKTLLKNDDLRLVLTLMDAGRTIKDHHADGSISIQVLLGKLRLTAEGVRHEVPARNLFSLPPSLSHNVHAVEPTAFVLTISWPPSEKLSAIPHRGYGS